MHDMDGCDVVDAWSPLMVFYAGILPHEVLLCMACHLSWCFGDHKVPGNVPPVSLTMLLKSHQKSPSISRRVMKNIRKVLVLKNYNPNRKQS